MPAEPRGSAHVATEATDTLLCRIEGVVLTRYLGTAPHAYL